ncbi:hypothetical protein BD414DRAFT_517061 [Trametes punicea]|nr:hypothetical protein BD414DRAFT_517061 [Trametes punicea]
MTNNVRKRRHPPFQERLHDPATRPSHPEPSLYVHVHEADLVRGPQAIAAARSLEVVRHEENGKVVTEVGDALIRLSRGRILTEEDPSADDHFQLGVGLEPTAPVTLDNEGTWVDRYDARLLLDALPTASPQSDAGTAEPSSPGGWSDLPSDAEDTFFLSPEEVDDYHREKRRRVIHEDREARLRALRLEGEIHHDEAADPREDWGGSDEEPDEVQLELMRRTASHVLASPNPGQLEMRILANHGADPRFAFLRGRWSRAWRLLKTKIRLEAEAEKNRAAEEGNSTIDVTRAGIGALAGYGESDDDDNADDGGRVNITATLERSAVPASQEKAENSSDDALKAARRARAREWVEMRRAAKETGGGG